ncbi:MAG TPA: hypothetical protein VMO47_06850, partial [Rhodothermales bacterium]|nr:hypothetical protein [Rhodothermales bacterium]
MRRSLAFFTFGLAALVACPVFAQLPDRDIFRRHIRSEADSLERRVDRFAARHGKGAFRLGADPEVLIGLSRISNGRPTYRVNLDLKADQAV